MTEGWVHTDASKGATEWAVWHVGYTSGGGDIWVAAVLQRQGGGLAPHVVQMTVWL